MSLSHFLVAVGSEEEHVIHGRIEELLENLETGRVDPLKVVEKKGRRAARE